MTFSIIAKCGESGAFGAAVTTSNLAVGTRCVRLAHGVGAFLSQHRTDPRLGDVGIGHLKDGLDAKAAIARTAASSTDIEWRQLAALDAAGRGAAYHGKQIYSIYSHAMAEGCLAVGNILANEHVTRGMIEAFTRAADHAFAERLLIALEAGRDAGGEIIGPLRSASLRITGEEGIEHCDLRIDHAETDAVSELRALYDAYRPQGELLRTLALAPGGVPVSRALFDASVERIKELGLTERFPSESQPGRWDVQ